MLSTNERYEIEIGMPLLSTADAYVVTWAVYRRHRFCGDQPVYVATTPGCREAYTAHRLAQEAADAMATELG